MSTATGNGKPAPPKAAAKPGPAKKSDGGGEASAHERLLFGATVLIGYKVELQVRRRAVDGLGGGAWVGVR